IITAKKYQWKMVTTWPPKFPILGEACEIFAERVKTLSGGRMEIRVYGGNELVPALEAFDTVREGGAELGCGAAYYWAGKAEAAQFFASVPFGMNAQQLNAWMVSGGLELWEELYAEFNLIPMPGGNTGVQMGGWFNKEINAVEDLKGLKMRIPGLGGKVLQRAGGAPVLMAGGEIYTGLERGVIDATEWLGPFHDTLMGFHEIAEYYYSPGWHEPGTMLEFFVNKEQFEQLPSDLQGIIKTVSSELSGWILSQMEANNAVALAKFLEKGINLRRFPDEVINQMRTYTQEAIDEITARDPRSKKVYESYRSFQQKAANFAAITEKAYYNQIQIDPTISLG
ncbi:MAG: TRAP transporter substrate-binding protein, partial [Phaeodactylibacter sp.]|nr:TRAP transporter substrate-binding protein [Phaeodactylibacter sp.]